MTEPAFVGAGKTPGLELWRIENFAPVKQPKATGKFYTGDSYILLSTTKSKSGALSWAIHFWLGAESSLDEQGVAAYKSVELDDSLGGGPVQYREVQGNESKEFLTYFKSSGGIEYLPGGITSGFRKVEKDVYPTRLLHLKGQRTVRVTEVPLKLASLNRGDVFILDKGLKIYLFNGPQANKYEKTKGIEVASRINSDERGARAEIIILDDDIKNSDFWGEFGGFKEPSSLPDGGSDDIPEVKITRKVFKISDASGSLEFSDVTPASGKLEKSVLDTNDVFLVQAATGKIYLWIGRKSNAQEKKEATNYALKYIEKNGLPKSTQIERVSEGTETGSFKAEFAVWEVVTSLGTKTSKVTADTPIDVRELLSRQQTADVPVDDGKGKLDIWVIKDFKKVPVNPANYGEFFGGDSYILLYTYLKNRSEEYIIYFWLGNDSSADEKGAAALLTVELDDSLGGKPVQVRVTQGKEPAHFRQLFKGKTIVYKGGNTSGFEKSSGSVEQGDVALFHVKGTNALNTVALEVNPIAASLNSQDTFVLVTPSTVYTWYGHGANQDEIAVATNVSAALAGKYKGVGGRVVVPTKEGEEPADFWTSLGGQTEYASVSPGEPAPRDARLFSASTATGKFAIEEVTNFDQSDLNDEDVYLLDTYTQIFAWIGSQSTQEEKTKALEFAQRFVAEADDGRDPDIPIVRVLAGQEPAMFSSHFHGWDDEFTKKRIFKDPYQAKLDALAAEKAKKAASAPAPAATPAAPVVPVKAATPGSFSYEDLKSGIPAGVDPTQKEEYLDDATFNTVFGMDRAAFRALPKWKRDDFKKKKGLF